MSRTPKTTSNGFAEKLRTLGLSQSEFNISSKGVVDRTWKRLVSWIRRSKMAIRDLKNLRKNSNLRSVRRQ
ncbi:hypothetical protein FOIG_16811 [Fusarium odoratissimum NRRL 54006]|uniref:Uncharacterized protein n=1 Tax=Fusarium odoratissimum (strain NRRL 54006) TaxID=1089451 RepID=X0ILZ5_FUSO5|nr:uncharacterized protein FOIG_16811 [Fusarium odoratissimum NRRL 54006]EXL89908.1 hypothetical protein FOIG_16811 [Fusarium odoratissimum NRRL 54006]